MYINQKRQWRTSKPGLLLQILIVLLPPVFFLENLYLLLGISCSLLLAWLMLRIQHKTWNDVGLHKPEHLGRLLLITLIATATLLPLSHIVISAVKILSGQSPNLEAFEMLRGNIAALAGGLVIAWIFGAFIEELLLRGFLLNTLYALLAKEGGSHWFPWTLAVFVTSIVTGIGHCYQGIVGMIGTGLIALGFCGIYLMNRRNLWSCILAHGLYDTVGFILVYMGIHS